MKTIALIAAVASATLTWQVTLDSTMKGLALLVVAAIAVGVMRKHSASARHLVWVAAMVGLLLLPALSLTLPKWRVLPASMGMMDASPAPVLETTDPKGISDAPETPFVGEDAPMNLEAGIPVTRPTLKPVTMWGSMTGTAVLLIAWFAIALILVIRLGLSLLALQWLQRRSQILQSGPIVDVANAVCRQLEIRRPIQVLLSENGNMPMAWGIFQGRVLLPTEAHQWSEAQLRAVLLHELGHLKRWDPLVHLIVQIACVLYWFNPMVWYAARRIHVERECACDDLVLQSGLRASDYAKHLLDIVSGYPGRSVGASSAVAMARPSRLEGRLVAIMSDRLNRQTLPAKLVAGILALGVVTAFPFAMIQAQVRSSDGEDGPAGKETSLRTGERAALAENDSPDGAAGIGEGSHVYWGEKKGGLQLGVRLNPHQESYAIGQEIVIRSIIRNGSTKDHYRFSLIKGVRGMPRITLVDEKTGEQAASNRVAIGGRPTYLQHHLKPGATTECSTVKLVLIAPGADPSADFASLSAEVSPGRRYRVQVSANLPDAGPLEQNAEDADFSTTEQWQGALHSGVFQIPVADAALEIPPLTLPEGPETPDDLTLSQDALPPINSTPAIPLDLEDSTIAENTSPLSLLAGPVELLGDLPVVGEVLQPESPSGPADAVDLPIPGEILPPVPPSDTAALPEPEAPVSAPPVPPSKPERPDDLTALESVLNQLNESVAQADPELQERIAMFENAFKAQAALELTQAEAQNINSDDLATIFELAGKERASNERLGRNGSQLKNKREVFAGDGKIALVENGTLQWTSEMESQFTGEPVVMEATDTVIVTDASGRVLGLSLKTGKLKWVGHPVNDEGDDATDFHERPSETPSNEGAAAQELIDTWAELVALREQAAAQAKKEINEGLAPATDLVEAYHSLLEARIGYADAAGGSPSERLKLYEQQVQILEEQAAIVAKHFKQGANDVSSRDVQQARSNVVEARVKLLEHRKRTQADRLPRKK